MKLPSVVSLFSGAGGLDLGFHQAGFSIALAVDISEAAIKSHQRNFPSTTSIAEDLLKLGPDGLVDKLEAVLPPGEAVGIIGGPPCQGFSRANTGSRFDDPRNRLPMLYLDIVDRLQRKYEVQFALFENVLGIQDRKHQAAFAGILGRLDELGLKSNVNVYRAEDFGVPQKRRRVIISAFRSAHASQSFKPTRTHEVPRTVRSAIDGLPEPAYFASKLSRSDIPHHPNHWTMTPKSSKFQSTNKLASTGRSFRLLEWDKPSPTVAYGHREIHVHPRGHRRLSVFEAMRLQGFPDDFELEGTLSAQFEQVCNAVPPPLAKSLAVATANALDARDVDAF